MYKTNNRLKKLICSIFSACLTFSMISLTAPKASAETGSGSSTIYYDIELHSSTSFSVGDVAMLAYSNTLSNPNYAGFSLPSGVDARGTVSTLNNQLEGEIWDTSYSPVYGLTVNLRSAEMDTHNGWIGWTGSQWQYHCTGDSDRGIYYAYTVKSDTFSASNVTITENSVPTTGTVTPSDITITIAVPGKTLTLGSGDYSFTDSTLNAATGDCTYAVNINGVRITKFKSSRANGTISSLDGLTSDEVTYFQSQLTGSENDSEVAEIIEKAKLKADINNATAEAKPRISSLKTDAKNQINAMTNLSSIEKLYFTNEVDDEVDDANTTIESADTVAKITSARDDCLSLFQTFLMMQNCRMQKIRQ